MADGPAIASIVHAGQAIPFVPLAYALDAPGDGLARVSSAVVVVGEGGLAALGVERLLGRASLLVRPLPALAAADPVVSGLSLDAEGTPRPVLDADRLVECARARRSPASPAPAPPPPILVVDDSLTTRMLEQGILEAAGYEVEVAASGEEALEKARRRRYSLLLVDVEMPGMDGFTLLEQLRGDAELRGIPALLVTSRQAPEDKARGLQAGARGYIVKSEFDQTELLATIRGLVG
jgi:two-component system, chemotaxis family, sensor kinase CheA